MSNPVYAPILGALGIVSAVALSAAGAAYGTAKCSSGIITVTVMRSDLMIRSLIPVLMAGILAIFGLVIAVMMYKNIGPNYSVLSGSLDLAAGLSMGFCALAGGMALGVVGDAGVRGMAQQPRLFVGMLLICIFAEVLGLYGLIVGVLLIEQAKQGAAV